MARISIENFGPIEHMDIKIKQFNVIFGEQASGKSTILKLIYFFQYEIERVYFLWSNNQFKNNPRYLGEYMYSIIYGIEKNFVKYFKEYLTDKFTISYEDFEGKKTYVDNTSDKLIFDINSIKYFIDTELKKMLEQKSVYFDNFKKGNVQSQIIFVPASRSSINRLKDYAEIINVEENVYNTLLEWPTSTFIKDFNLISKILSDGILAYLNEEIENEQLKDLAISLSNAILKGVYKREGNEDRIYFKEDKFIKLKNASSGQQEALSIINTLIYFINKKGSLFIEEPEAHLFPKSQKYITDLMALCYNIGNNIFITTHSPYILSSLGNLMYAQDLVIKNNLSKDEINKVINENLWLNKEDVNALFLKNGKLINMLRDENTQIDPEFLDSVSDLNYEIFNRLFELGEVL